MPSIDWNSFLSSCKVCGAVAIAIYCWWEAIKNDPEGWA